MLLSKPNINAVTKRRSSTALKTLFQRSTVQTPKLCYSRHLRTNKTSHFKSRFMISMHVYSVMSPHWSKHLNTPS